MKNNYPIGMHPPIDVYKYPENKDEWLHCPKCGFQPRVWEFDNGRSTHCGCSSDMYDHFSVKAKPIGDVIKENNGDMTKYDTDELRKNWNKYCEKTNNNTMNYISETIKEFDEEFDWREIQYDGKMYVPTDNVKDFLQSKLEGLIDSIRGDIARYAGINDIQTKELIELLKEYK